MTEPAVINAINQAIGALRVNNCPNAANDLILDVIPAVTRLAAALAETKALLPANDPARIEAEAVLKIFREGCAP